MIQVYADSILIYDSRLDEPEIEGATAAPFLALTATLALNKSGMATFTVSRDHPILLNPNALVPRRSVVEIYRNNVRFFRGRVLYSTDDFLLRRTFTCEGERGFLHDGLIRPGSLILSNPPEQIFRDVIAAYNDQVDDFKKFIIDEVDVTDPNVSIELELDDAESCSDMLDRLVERCGGYITFGTSTAPETEGARTINWTASVGVRSRQVIEYGENLLDFSRTGANDDIVTVVVPYGKKSSSGVRLTIGGISTGGRDYISAPDLISQYGVITRAVYWDDITDPYKLLAKAEQYLEDMRNRVTSLELTAFDLSLVDKSIDRFHLGDEIRVKSRVHNVDAYYLLEEQKIDFLNPQNDKVVLGKATSTLTGSGAASGKRNTANLQTLEKIVRADYTVNQPAIVEETKLALASLIQQASDAIMLEVSEQFATNGDVENVIQTTMTQLADSFEFLFYQLETRVDSNDVQARTQFEEIAKYIRFVDGNIILGEQGNEITLRIENDRLSFLDDGAEVAYFSNKKLTVLDGSFLNSLQIGKFKFLPRENGNLSLVKVGG